MEQQWERKKKKRRDKISQAGISQEGMKTNGFKNGIMCIDKTFESDKRDEAVSQPNPRLTSNLCDEGV